MHLLKNRIQAKRTKWSTFEKMWTFLSMQPALWRSHTGVRRGGYIFLLVNRSQPPPNIFFTKCFMDLESGKPCYVIVKWFYTVKLELMLLDFSSRMFTLFIVLVQIERMKRIFRFCFHVANLLVNRSQPPPNIFFTNCM